MNNKCPNCGFEYGEEDIFCSRCGHKIAKVENQTIREINKFTRENDVIKNPEKSTFKRKNILKFFDNIAFSSVIFMIIILGVLCVSLLVILKGHDEQRVNLQYRNLINNPAQIPMLKEPSTYIQLNHNLKDVEDFLALYLKNSSDSADKKTQVFISYLNQIEKMPNVLNQKFIKENISECQNVNSASRCVSILNDKFKNRTIKAYLKSDTIYLYPSYKKIAKKYSPYLDFQLRRYLKLLSKYDSPVCLGIDLNIMPKKLASKIYDFEKMYKKYDNEFINDKIEQTLYFDIRKFIFNPKIYATNTHEMKKEYKNAYSYFVNTKKDSVFRPLFMSYLEKGRSYSEDNFKADYPMKLFEVEDFSKNVENSSFDDVFAQLRKNFFDNKTAILPLSFVYSVREGKWKKYSSNMQLNSDEFVISEPDENNNISIYNNMFSPMQELNILKYSKLYLIADTMYIFNKDKLSISRITYNGRTFNLYNLSNSDITSLFPGIEIINMDTLSNYDTLILKDNAKVNYIILSRYSQGWNDYNISPVKGSYGELILPNMFSINSNDDVEISFSPNQAQDENQGFIEQKPSYKFIMKTRGHKPIANEEDRYTQFDEKTKNEELDEVDDHTPNIMPKLPEASKEENEIQNLPTPPIQKIEPPIEINDTND